MNNLDEQYINLLQDILDNGVEKSDRTGTGTKSVFGRQIRHKMSEGFPLLTTKKMPFKTIVTELLWFLRGDTNIKYLVDNGCNIWNGDAYKNYCNHPDTVGPLTMAQFIDEIKTNKEFSDEWGELGPIYGAQWRNWDEDNYGGIDQIKNLIEDLKKNPDSRRLMVTAWNPSYLPNMILPPCHYGFQVYTRELSWEERRNIAEKTLSEKEFHGYQDESGTWHGFGHISPCTNTIIHYWLDRHNIPKRSISLMWNQRSVDTFLGLPFNIASYGLLLEILAKEVNMVPDELIGNLGDTHLYLNHIDQAIEQMGSEISDKQLNKLFKELDAESFEAFVTAKRLKSQAVKETDYEEAAKQRDIEKIAKAKLAKLELPIHDRQPFDLPTLKIKDSTYGWGVKIKLSPKSDELFYNQTDFTLENYKSHGPIKAPLSN